MPSAMFAESRQRQDMHLFRARQRRMKLLVVLLPATKLPWPMPVDGRIRLKGQLLALPQPGQRCADTRVVADQADRNHFLMMAGQRCHFRQLPIRLDRAKELGGMIGTNGSVPVKIAATMNVSFLQN